MSLSFPSNYYLVASSKIRMAGFFNRALAIAILTKKEKLLKNSPVYYMVVHTRLLTCMLKNETMFSNGSKNIIYLLL